MIVSEKSYKNPSEYIQFLSKKIYKFNKNKGLFLVKRLTFAHAVIFA